MVGSLDMSEDGERALAEARWEDAHELLEAAVAREQSPHALDALSRAAWWTGRTLEAIETRERAYQGYRRIGDTARAVMAALWLSQEYEAVEGRGVRADGWLERAVTLIEGRPPSVEHGWLALARARRSSDTGEMESESRVALEWGRNSNEIDLEIRALSSLGLALGGCGKIDQAFRVVDEAMVAATSEDSVALETIGETFCDAFALMELVGDSERLAQWSEAMNRFVRRHQYGPLVAFCGTCCGELLVGSGDLRQAEHELTSALERLERTSSRARCAHPAAKLAELRLVQGRTEEAKRLLDDYRGMPDMARVEAQLSFMAGELDLVKALIERQLAELGDDGPRSVPHLIMLVDVHVEAGDLEAAHSAVERLDAVAASSGLAKVKAEAQRARGRVALASGETTASQILEDALRRFLALDRPLDASRVRMLIAESVQSQNPELAAAETRAALATFERLGARRDADIAAAQQRRLGVGTAPGPRVTGELTRREEEVLVLLGDGLTNAEIGERLYISSKTVEHHVSRILGKLGMRNRVQAGAYAAGRAAEVR